MANIDTSSPVLVTGATGYVAGWLVKLLLEKGITVHAAVRDPQDERKLAHLNALAARLPGRIRYFRTDLLTPGSYAEAMEGCGLVYHTASPFTYAIKDPMKDLVAPAVEGTRNVLEHANRCDSVRRVVLTSSCAAIYCDCSDLQAAPGHIFTEELWNTKSSLDYQPYSYSKTLAEKEAWTISRAQQRWDLVVINPSLVMGPPLNPATVTSESFSILKQFGDGTMKMGTPDIGVGIVDVREVALAHLNAGFTPEAEGRHIVSGHNSSFWQMAQLLQPFFGDRYPLPKKRLPKGLLMLVGPFINKALSRHYIRENVNLPWRADNSKSIRALGIQYRPLEETLRESFQSLIDAKQL